MLASPIVLEVSHVCVGNTGGLDEDVTGGPALFVPRQQLVEKYPRSKFKPCLNKQQLEKLFP